MAALRRPDRLHVLLPCAGAGTRASTDGGNGTRVHQHGGCATPVTRWISMAHWFGVPHNGQRPGSGGVSGSVMEDACIKR